MIASASLASRPASFSTQFAFLCTISRISGSLASSARAVQRMAASSIGTWRSSLIAEASAWPSRARPPSCAGASDRALDDAAEALVIEAFENVGDQARGAGADARAFAGRGLEEAPGRAGDVELLHAPRDHARNEEILTDEIGERLADPVLVTRDDRGVRDRQAERVAEQGRHREPVGEAADHRRFGERLHVARGRDIGARTRARRRTPRPSRRAARSRRPSFPARQAAPG